ncbi:MAG: Eco57I restriction-modification methylase domain-containing protein [Proteobacteria bacterium]|nr:Eco57I restriction-modification methylase domain-containing protein [Pseudomonadota bacterium]
MKAELNYFNTKDFHLALRIFFEKLQVPVSYIAEESARPQDILLNNYRKDHDAFQLMDDVYFIGMVDDAAFEGNRGIDPAKIESDYDGILIFGVTLIPRDNGLLPTRSHLAEITRAFNREYHYTPVVVIFKYENLIAFANAERLEYKQEWREGEKAGKVSMLRDINPENPHSGHLRILSELAIQRTGTKAIKNFADLYTYWQTVFNVSLLNKKFYEELSNWYFWAVKEVVFPSEPTIHSLFEETGSTNEDKLRELQQEHNAKNVIRLLTRFLFVWFIKEKKLIPQEFFDLVYLKNELLEDLSPFRKDDLFKSTNISSHFYKAILQNLFFATLNQEMGKRAFRKDKQNMNVTNLLRYEDFFKDSQKFITLVESIVPFMNGGLFECLDKPHSTKKGPKGGDIIVYKDGFSDRSDNPLRVPDYLFFGRDENIDLSSIIGIKNTKTTKAGVKGLIKIFESYKFTLAENTPIEEDIALDPELLGKVFENLLASYNPETKTTARKQTGSFYTPREIVNYMVDESLITYLKKGVTSWDIQENELDNKLHQLLSFDTTNPFADNQSLQKEIIKVLDCSTILDPACGSGAFPMGILQKMVHILQKVDPLNTHWRELQMEKATRETESTFHLADKEAREQKLNEINEAFDRQVNDPDYARKLFLIENCIYGVDIQPIAVQISKLRFFISLVVDQKVDKNKINFAIRPLPNLETKFVAANTLIGIKKPDRRMHLFANQEIKKLEEELKDVRHRIFSARTPSTKRKLRGEDQGLREKMGELLVIDGWENKTAKQLAGWDPYDQNSSSSFFDPEWMFGIENGFDVVIGNPPYLGHKEIGAEKQKVFKNVFGFTDDMYNYFYHKGISLLNENGIITYITPNTFLTLSTKANLRKLFISRKLNEIFLVGYVFNEAYVDTVITSITNASAKDYTFTYKIADKSFFEPNQISANISLYKESLDNVYFPPHFTNLTISKMLSENICNLNIKYRNAIASQSALRKNYQIIADHREALTHGDLTLLGLVTEGAQGLVTGNNSKYLAIICDDREEQEIYNIKLRNIIKEHKDVFDLKVNNCLELYDLAEGIKLETKNVGFFGKFFIYKTVLRNDLRHYEHLTIKEQVDGIREGNTWIYYSRGNNEGVKWQVPFVEAIDWSYSNVRELKESKLTNSRWQGSEFYAQTGFGWVDYFTNRIKAFFVERGPYSKNIVKFHSMINVSDKIFTAILNSTFISFYIKNFITNTHTLQINDGKQIPVIIPSDSMSQAIELIVSMVLLNQSVIFENIADSLIFELYFPKHLKDREIDVLQFVERDIDVVIQNRNFNILRDNEKEDIINQLHAKWTHPDSNVRNRIKLFAVRSPDFLKPILESR